MSKSKKKAKRNRYESLIEKIFFDRYQPGITEFSFLRKDLSEAANELEIKLPKNLGDLLYSFRFRTELPNSIVDIQPEDKEWIIELAGKARYLFRLTTVNRIVPNPSLQSIKIPDATPEIVAGHSLSDEQALLAKVRYNRLIDIFLGITTYSLQNHLRTTVKGIGQIEIDEVYVGLDKHGSQYVIPVQAKGGNDQLAVVQTKQDIKCCEEKFPYLLCKPISAQFIEDDLIALFELTIEDELVKIVEERHYKLVPFDSIDNDTLTTYRQRSAR